MAADHDADTFRQDATGVEITWYGDTVDLQVSQPWLKEIANAFLTPVQAREVALVLLRAATAVGERKERSSPC